MDMEQMEKMLRAVVSEELELKLKPIQKQLDMLATETADTLATVKIINEKVASINGKLDSIRKDIEYTYIKTSMNELEINRLKLQ
jgi:hypothetical protein